MADIHITDAKKNLSMFGFLNVDVDSSLDLFYEIEHGCYREFLNPQGETKS